MTGMHDNVLEWSSDDPWTRSFPPASAVEGIKSVPSVCPSVCLLVSALLAEPLDIVTRNSVWMLTSTISRISSKVKVIGQRSRSQYWKIWFFDRLPAFDLLFCNIWRHVMSWCEVMTTRDVMTSHDVTAWRDEGHVEGGRANAPAFSFRSICIPELIANYTLSW